MKQPKISFPDYPDLTYRQREIFLYIKEFIVENGYNPYMPEVSAYFGMKSDYGAQSTIERLIKKGYLKKIGDRPRIVTYTLAKNGDNTKK